jgi:glycosyltransferase involved in cell wall biosynthesis
LRILFTLIGNSRRSNYLTGDNIRNGGGGGSGTDTSTILVAEYLASQGHDVVIVSEKLEPLLEEKYKRDGNTFKWGTISHGVMYSNFEFENVPYKEFDILVNSLWFQDYNKLPVKITKGLIYWCHMQWLYGMGEIAQFALQNNLKLGFVHISEWEKSNNAGVASAITHQVKGAISTIIPNPVFDEIINQVNALNISKKPHKFIFHASWPRGGNVAIEAVRQLPFPDKEFHAFDYLMVIHDHKDAFFHVHNGVDKLTLFKHLAESEYFVYPLYTPYQDVHKDTFSCVVAEALALGTSVVTYPLGALPENFDKYVHWLDFPAGADPVAMQKESLSKDLDGKFKTTSNIVDKINFLEANPDVKNSMKEAGRKYVLDSFNIKKVGGMWVDFIEKLMS